MLFTYDQAFDATNVLEILSGDFKILGAPSGITGLFHGPFYYYLLTPAYLIGRGDPRFALIEIILLNLASAIPLAILSQKLFKSRTVTILCVLLYMASFEAVSYGRWLSNPTIALPALSIFYLGLWQVIRGEKWGWILTAVGLGAAIQAQVFLIYLIVIVPLILLIFKIKPNPKKFLAMGLVIFLAFLSPFMAAEIKYHFKATQGLFASINTSSTQNYSFSDHAHHYIYESARLAKYNLFPPSREIAIGFGLIILGLALYCRNKSKTDKLGLNYLFLLLFSSVILFVFSNYGSYYINIGTLFPLILITSYVLTKIPKIMALATLVIIILGNVASIVKYNQQGNILFQVQEGMILKDRLDLIKKTFEFSADRQFSINSATNPLFYPTTWAYLYQLYAKANNLTLPHYHGNTASTFKGDHVFPRSGEITPVEFTIIEPDIPKDWVSKIIAEDDLRKPVTQKLHFGAFTLLVRE